MQLRGHRKAVFQTLTYRFHDYSEAQPSEVNIYDHAFSNTTVTGEAAFLIKAIKL